MTRLEWPAPAAGAGPILIAHRGASGTRPENTEAAFLHALSAGVRTWECDARLTRDGFAVVIHDALLDRTTDGKGPVHDTTLADLRRLSAGYRLRFGEEFVRQRVPTLEEALRLARGEARLLIEVKTDGGDSERADQLTQAVVDHVTAAGAITHVAVVSFDLAVLEIARGLTPELATGLLVSPMSAGSPIQTAARCGARLLIPARSLLTPALVEAARDASLLVASYLFQNVEELDAVLPLGLYGVATDYPDRLAAHPAVRRV